MTVIFLSIKFALILSDFIVWMTKGSTFHFVEKFADTLLSNGFNFKNITKKRITVIIK
jgi:hypothetical protein